MSNFLGVQDGGRRIRCCEGKRMMVTVPPSFHRKAPLALRSVDVTLGMAHQPLSKSRRASQRAFALPSGDSLCAYMPLSQDALVRRVGVMRVARVDGHQRFVRCEMV